MQHSRKGKGDCLSGTSLGNGDDVATAQSHGPRLTLNSSGRGESLGADGRHHVFGEVNFIEGGNGTGNVAALDLENGVSF